MVDGVLAGRLDPDDRTAGQVRQVQNGELDWEPLRGVPPVQTGGDGNLQGLMDMALHPRFSDTHWVYLAYHKPSDSGRRHHAGSRHLERGIVQRRS